MNDKLKKLIETYNALEELFKTSQIVQNTFKIPVLNEYRYLSRALIDLKKAELENNSEYQEKALSRIEVALSAAYNDIIDSIISNIKAMVDDFYKNYPNKNVSDILEKYNYNSVKEALLNASKIIIQSRYEREKRFDLYKDFSNSKEYENLKYFCFNLPAIEFELNKDTSLDQQQIFIVNNIENAFNNYFENNDKYPRFDFVLQPKYDSKKTIIGAEALVRLYIDDNKEIKPLNFLYLVDLLDKQDALDLIVLEEVQKFIRRNEDIKNVPISVNASPRTISENNQYMDTLNVNDIDNLEVEIIESWNDNNSEHMKIHYKLGQINEKIKIAIDDFGTGSTKLDYLALIDNLKYIKIDKILIDGLITYNKEKYLNLISGIKELAEKNNLVVIAEGIETIQQFQELQKANIEYFQGYYFSKPIDKNEFLKIYT